MVTIQPFKGIRPTKALARQVATFPYDVLNSAEARVLGDKNPYSYLHIDKAEIDLPQSISPYDNQVYKKAATNLQTFLQKKMANTRRCACTLSLRINNGRTVSNRDCDLYSY